MFRADYVGRYFDAAARARVAAMVARIVAAARVAVQGAAWLSAPARTEALAKLDRLTAKLGYPDAWTDDAALEICAGDAFDNRARAQRLAWSRLAAAAAKPIDRARWQMSPLETDAFYDPMLNQIVLPAAHLQAPWFDAQADDAANYGGLGALIAHEISHAFDPQGAQFDASGALRAWWQRADQQAFGARSDRLVAQYGAFEALPGAHVDGKLTLPENVADVAGLQIAWAAYQQSLAGRTAPVLDGLDGAQRFFIAYAQTWRVKQRDELQRQLLVTDPHAPARWRADGPARNSDAFQQAFHTQPGDAMYVAPAERVRLW
ncbi:MAG: M13 family metallopeptidase [Pelomonas sp.]|nr:M13 family metallopeptidase [Roseateles sp.]